MRKKTGTGAHLRRDPSLETMSLLTVGKRDPWPRDLHSGLLMAQASQEEPKNRVSIGVQQFKDRPFPVPQCSDKSFSAI